MSRKEPNSKRNWYEDYELENGKYYGYCSVCSNEFLGHKRRVICRDCFIKGKEPEVKPMDGSDAASCEKCCHAVIKELVRIQRETKSDTRRPAQQAYSERYRLVSYPASADECIKRTADLCGAYKINLVIMVEPTGLVWAYAVADIPGIVECDCPCHEPGANMLHITGCCQGSCKDCGKGFHSGLSQHIQACCPLVIKDLDFLPPTTFGGIIGKIPQSMLEIKFSEEVQITSKPMDGFSSEPNRGGDAFHERAGKRTSVLWMWRVRVCLSQ
jgi:hypothetical protein